MSGRFVNPSIVWLSTSVISLSLFGSPSPLYNQSMIVMPTVARAELPAANVLLVWVTIILSADRTHTHTLSPLNIILDCNDFYYNHAI